MLSRKGLSSRSICSWLLWRKRCDCSPRISVARLRNCRRKVSSCFSRAARSASRSSALRCRRAAISAAEEARRAASSASVRPCSAVSVRSCSSLRVRSSRSAPAACSAAAARVSACIRRPAVSRSRSVASAPSRRRRRTSRCQSSRTSTRATAGTAAKRMINGVTVMGCISFFDKCTIYLRNGRRKSVRNRSTGGLGRAFFGCHAISEGPAVGFLMNFATFVGN